MGCGVVMKILSIYCLSLFFLTGVFSAGLLNADSLSKVGVTSSTKRIRINNISVTGNYKTKESLILSFANILKNRLTSKKDIEVGIQRLRNTTLFTEVSYTLKLVAENKYDIDIKAHDKWTTIPIVKFNSGGGVKHLTLGLFDPNVAGSILEAGGQYEWLSGEHSGVIWFKNPRFTNYRHAINVQFWMVSRIRALYDQASNAKRQVNTYIQENLKVYLEHKYEVSPKIFFFQYYEYANDEFNKDELKEDEFFDAAVPEESITHIFGLKLQLGTIESKKYFQYGTQLDLDVSVGRPEDQELKSYIKVDTKLLYFKNLYAKIDFTQRINYLWTGSDQVQNKFFFGGLETIRGFADRRFYGRTGLLSNSEVRAVVWENSWVAIQPNAFVDFAATAESAKDLFSDSAASVGGGVRFILPKVYRSVLRFDWAVPVRKEDDSSFSFGAQQFF